MITPTEELYWRTRGAIVPGHQLEIDSQVIHDIEQHYKNKGSVESDFGSDPELSFPTKYESINDICVNKELISIAGQLLNAPPLLIQAVAWGKTKKSKSLQSNDDQRMHMDYGNNTWVHPPPFHNPNVAACILYLSNTEETGGGTAIVAREGMDDPWYKPPYIQMPGQNGIPFINNKKDAEKMLLNQYGINRKSLYNREIIPNYEIGDMLWYRHDVWHRGTPVKKDKIRYVISLAWKKPNATVLNWNMGFTQKMYYGWLEEFICSLNAYQLHSIGFPHPLNSYWCRETIRNTKERFKSYEFDLDKYLESDII
jgi:hypothetical protein